MSTVKAAVVQAGSIPFSPGRTISKGIEFIVEAAQNGAELVVFPEAFLGGYPKGASFGSPVGKRTDEGRNAFLEYFKGSIEIDGPEIEKLVRAANEHSIFIVMGIIEKSLFTLYCTVVYIDPVYGLVGKHRKLMPTGGERLIWGFGDGSTLPVFETPVGKAGAVICWENYMPLMRAKMYAEGITIYCAPTADDRDSWLASMRHIALEGRCYVLSACQFMTRGDFPNDYDCLLASAKEPDKVLMRGASAIFAPNGDLIAGPVFDCENIIYADISQNDVIRSKLDFDPVGHYARPDIFQLHVDIGAKEPVTSFDSFAATGSISKKENFCPDIEDDS
ncbi:carbon-nitrogen hydrolase family protein [Kushneria aurantia]|uniref:Carbon-nitrogen hydrolase family protein n=1 Tax=Kushneria aurantia TaxID=504092 RepID=A0ABV6G2J7_9GAMM|nr:carbon-nitrogen hydrolase family protein [Kushneria aurantia]